jgi:hypothetical protein
MGLRRLVTTTELYTDLIATGATESLRLWGTERTFQVVGVTSSGAGSASVKIQVSNDNVNWMDLGTITLTLSTTASSDGLCNCGAWGWTRANVTAISGTGASIDVWLGNIT